MNLVEIISQEKFAKYRMDDVEEFAENVCFVQTKGQEFLPDSAVVMWGGYFTFFQEYLMKKKGQWDYCRYGRSRNLDGR